MKVASYMLFAAFALASLFGAFAMGALVGPELRAQLSNRDVTARGVTLLEAELANPARPAQAYIETEVLERVYVSCETLPAVGSDVIISGQLGTYCPDSVCFAQIVGTCF